MKIDLNSDIGEGYGRYRVADDDGLMEVLSSANVACGFHAGDPSIMDHIVTLAKGRGVAIGAHPGMPDVLGFGRRAMQLSVRELETALAYQIGALQGISASAGHRVTHISYHAAFGNMATADKEIADVLSRAIARIDRDLIVYSMPGTEVEFAARRAGLRSMTLFLADRAYHENGELVSRKIQDSVITAADRISARVLQFLNDGTVTSFEGKTIKVRAKGILVHSDTPGSLQLARTIRGVIEAGGGKVAPAIEILA